MTDNLFLSPVSSVVQLRPQLNYLDALDSIPKPTRGGGKARKDDGAEDQPADPEPRAVDVKIKAAAAEDKEAALVAGNLELLKKMQEEKWAEFEWIDAEVSRPGSLVVDFANSGDCRRKKLGMSTTGTCCITMSTGCRSCRLRSTRRITWTACLRRG